MADLSDIQAYSRRTGIDSRGFVYISDRQGADELVETTLKAWDKLEDYEKEIDQAKQELASAESALNSARTALSNAKSNLASLERQLATLTPETDPDGSKAKALQASIANAEAAVASAQSRVNSAENRVNAAKAKVNNLEDGRLTFQRNLMDRLGLDSSRLTEAVDIRAQRDWTNFRPTNALEEWAKVVNSTLDKRDENGQFVEGEKVTGKEALASFMRYGLWNFTEMVKEFTDKLLRAIQRAASGKGFSFTSVD